MRTETRTKATIRDERLACALYAEEHQLQHCNAKFIISQMSDMTYRRYLEKAMKLNDLTDRFKREAK